MKSVANERSTSCESELGALVRGSQAVVHWPCQSLVARVDEAGGVKLIRTGLGDRVDQRSREITKPNVEWREEHLVFLHRVNWCRPRAAVAGDDAVRGTVD